MFLVNGRWFKTLCKTVLEADTFDVSISTEKHNILAHVSDKCYFTSIDNYCIGYDTIDTIKTDFFISRNFKNTKEFLSKLNDTLTTFLYTSIRDKDFYGNLDECIEKCLQDIKKAHEIDTTEGPKKRKPITTDIDMIKDFTKETETANTTPEINNKKSEINSMYGITANTSPEISNEYDKSKELLTVEQFERLTGTLCKSLFKAIGLEETRRIPIIISNNMVYFNYNGTQYKYNPAQCKVYKKSGRRYLRINWKDFTDDNSPADQNQAVGRSPPFTPDMRSTTIQ